MMLWLFIGVANSFSQSVELSLLFPGTALMQEQYGITFHITWHGYDYDNYHGNIRNIVEAGNGGVVR